MKYELISVIVPVHNAQDYIDKCLASIYNQSYDNIEVILILDNCSDNTLEICNNLKQANTLIIETENKSAGISRNQGINYSKGKYICFVDADDYIEKDYIQKLYCFLKSNNLDLSICGYNKFKEEKIERFSSFKSKVFDKKEIQDNIIKNCFRYRNSNESYGIIAVWAAIYKSEIIKDNNIFFYDENYYLSEDSIFNCEYLAHCEKIGFLGENLYFYNKGNQLSITKMVNIERMNGMNRWLNICRNYIDNENIDYLYKSYLLYLVDYIKSQFICSNNYSNFKKQVNEFFYQNYNLENIFNNINDFEGIPKRNRQIIILLKKKKYLIIYLEYFLYKLINK